MYAEHEAAMVQAINDPMSRRHFLWKNGVGLGGLALTCMLQEEAAALRAENAALRAEADAARRDAMAGDRTRLQEAYNALLDERNRLEERLAALTNEKRDWIIGGNSTKHPGVW